VNHSRSSSQEDRGSGEHSEATIIKDQDYGCYPSKDDATTTSTALDCTPLFIVVYASDILCF